MTNREQLAVAMFLIPDAVFFFLLIIAFKYFAEKPSLSSHIGWTLTLLLLASAASVWRGASGSRRWAGVAIVLGAAFLIGLFGTSFSVLTGILGLHIAAGMIALAVVPASALRAVALYWYFVIAVWLAIVLIFYI